MSPKQSRRLIIGLLALVGLSAAFGLVLYALSQNINLFFTPTDIAQQHYDNSRPFRLGGMVVNGSVVREQNLKVNFEVTDYAHNTKVAYKGILPDLFREGQGMVALGQLDENGIFVASEILAKHDENYMPPEVAQALKNKTNTLIRE